MANWTGTYTITTPGISATSGSTTAMANTGASWPNPNGLANMSLRMLTGANAGLVRTILTNNVTSMTVNAFPDNIVAGDTYEIVLLLQDQDHFTAATSFSTNTIVEAADNATLLVDGLYVIIFTLTCTTRLNKSETTLITFCANNRTIQGKQGFWTYLSFPATLSVKPYVSYVKIQDATNMAAIIPSATIGDATTIHHIWGEAISTTAGYLSGGAIPAGGATLSNYYLRSGNSSWVFSASTSAGIQTFSQCWADRKVFNTTGTFVFSASGSLTQWFRKSVIHVSNTSSLNAGATANQRVSECYFKPCGGSLAMGSANAADAGEHSYFMNISRSGRQLLGANAVGAGTLVSSSNDYRSASSYNAFPAINISNAAAYTSATSDYDYIAGNNSSCEENIDTTMSTSSTAVPQQYINLTAARTNARSVPNFPCSCDNVVVGTPTTNSVTVTYDCANGALAGQQTTVDSNSNSGQPVVEVAATSMFLVGMPVEIGYGTARSEEGRILSISAGVSITLKSNLIYTHTAADADAVVMQLRDDGLPLIKYGTASGVYSMSTALPDITDWGLVWTGIKTSFQGITYGYKRTGHSVTLLGLKPNTTYFFTACAYNPLNELHGSGEYSFTTAPTTGASYAASSVC